MWNLQDIMLIAYACNTDAIHANSHISINYQYFKESCGRDSRVCKFTFLS